MKTKFTRSTIVYYLFPALLISLLGNAMLLHDAWARSVVTRVPDGDSLQLADGRRIRLLGLDAPERDQCFAKDARDYLVSQTLNKRVRLTDVVTDDYGRQLANVFVGNVLINQDLVAKGFSRFVHVRSTHSESIKMVQNTAKENKIGIWSEACRKTMNTNSDCVIKGNLKSGKKIYHLPDCHNYDQTIIDESFGDRWFCTEPEALAAGYSKASGCPD